MYKIFFISIFFIHCLFCMEEDIQSNAASGCSGYKTESEDEHNSPVQTNFFYDFDVPLDIDPEVKREASKDKVVWVPKKILKKIMEEIEKKNKKKSKINNFLGKFKPGKSPRKKLEEKFKTDNESIPMTFHDVANFVIPSLRYYPRKFCDNEFASYLFLHVNNHPLFDQSHEICLKINDKPKKIGGALALCMNGLRAMHTCRSMGITFSLMDKL